MENKQTPMTKKHKKTNPMKKIGKGIKDTFIEMSTSLAGWIDDAGTQLSGKKSTGKKSQRASTTSSKTTSHQTKSKA